LLSITGALIYVHALKHIPLASAMAVGFTEPLFTTLWAVVLLKELFNKYMLFALGIGFTGTLIALNPSSESFSVYSLWVLAASIVWSADNLVIKFLGKTEKSVQYLFFISLFSTLFSAPVAIKVWQPVTLQHVPSILALAIFYFIHVIAVFKAFQYSNLSILAPFDFSRIVFSTFIGVLFFKDKINLWEITGALLIVFSSAYIVWKKEYDKNKRKLPRNLNPAANDV
jgi:S-adenosylmethionine uptake transporter